MAGTMIGKNGFSPLTWIGQRADGREQGTSSKGRIVHAA